MATHRIALLGSHSPRRCGIATFTDHLADAIAQTGPEAEVVVVAMNDGRSYAYPDAVRITVEQDDLAEYEAAADRLNAMGIDVLCVQHEFGIFGGPAGSFLLAMLRRVRAPIVTTLHTVLERFTPEQAEVMSELALLSTRLVVMSERAVGFLRGQGVPAERISLIPHGIPELPEDAGAEKARLGLAGRTVILTFGLLSPNKGIETALRALPEVVRAVPDVTYLVLGATHPHVRAREGENYRERLMALAAELGVAEHVRFDDRFADQDGITQALAAADLCLVPYLNREQITSGTLAYAVGNGKAVVSTPFWHAEELLAGGRGALVPFGDSAAMGTAVRDLLLDGAARDAMRLRARAYGVRMRWPNVARSYRAVFDGLARARVPGQPVGRVPALRLDHVMALTDDTGLLQHATGCVPNRLEGYTTDDNARALHLVALADPTARTALLAARTLAFVNHALHPLTRRFRNFMSYDRSWLDEHGGENAQARAVRALVTASNRLEGALGQTAREVLGRAWPALDGLRSPRAQAIALCALSEAAEAGDQDGGRRELAEGYAANLLFRLSESAGPGWTWFERSLSYSNAKIPHGLLSFGRVFGNAEAVEAGLSTLAWLETQQVAPDGSFLPIGSDRVYQSGAARPLWDGQPIEVHASVSAALAAHQATGDAGWLASARRALDWLLGRNLLGIPLFDAETGGCRDGLHPDRANANQGAESTLALWLSVVEYSRATRLEVTPRMSET